MYSLKVTFGKFYGILFFYIIFSVWQGVSQTYGRVFLESKRSRIWFSVVIDITFIATTIALYVLSIIKLRQHQRNSKQLGKSNQSITKLAKVYLIILLVCYVPYFVRYLGVFFCLDLSKHTVQIIREITGVIVTLPSCINGIAFLIINNSCNICRRRNRISASHNCITDLK